MEEEAVVTRDAQGAPAATMTHHTFDGDQGMPPSIVHEWALDKEGGKSIDELSVPVALNGPGGTTYYDTLSGLNDSGLLSFHDIANVIEEQS